MIQLEINQIGSAGSDCTAPYEVIIHGKCTVRDFVECVLTRNKEWGYIGIADGSILGSPRIEYARGVVTVDSDLFEKIENYIVVKASARGGWSRMDFLLTIEESEDKRGQVMTREEAIRILEEYRWIGRIELTEAITMAISALSAETATLNHEKVRITDTDSVEKVQSEQVTGKLKNPCDSLLTDDNNDSKEQKSKLDLISRADAIKTVIRMCAPICDNTNDVVKAIEALPSADATVGDYPNDLISRSALMEYCSNQKSKTISNNDIARFPSADAVPTVIRAKTFMRKEDFDKWAEDIKKQNKSIVCIPCDAEVVSANAVQGWRIGKPTEQGKYMVTLDSFGHKRIDLFYYGKPLMPNRKVRGKCWYRSDDEWGDVVYDDIDILAWMPLPKPYKGGEDE